MTSPTLRKIEKTISNLKRRIVGRPDGGLVLSIKLTEILARVLELDIIPSDRSRSLIVPVHKDYQKGISLANIMSNILASIIVRCLSTARIEPTRENHTDFKPGRRCIDQIFTPWKIRKHRRTFRRTTVDLYLDSIDRDVVRRCLSLEDVPKKYVDITQALCSNTSGRVRAYNKLSSESITPTGVRQCRLFFHFYVTFS